MINLKKYDEEGLTKYNRDDVIVVEAQGKEVAVQEEEFGGIKAIGLVEDRDLSSVYVDNFNSLGEDCKQIAKEKAAGKI